MSFVPGLQFLFMQLIGAIICVLVALRLLQSIAGARQTSAVARIRARRSLALLDQHIAATRALRIRREQERLHWNGYRKFRVKQKVREADSICSFYLVPHDGKPLPAFEPGQFLTFRFMLPGKTDGESRKVVRCYSLSDAPRSEQFRITVKRVPASDGQLAPGLISNYLHDEIEAGDLLDVQAPRGDFVLRPEETRPVVLIAGGIGVTPLLSMVNTLAAADVQREVFLFYAVRNGREHVMQRHLEELEATHAWFHLRVLYSEPTADDVAGEDYDDEGYLTLDRIRDTVRVCNYDFYVCGPPPMMQAVIPSLQEWGVEEHRIHTEAFGPATIQKPHTDVLSMSNGTSANGTSTNGHEAPTVHFCRTGRRLPWDSRCGSLLEFALNHGVDIDSGCRAGSCGSCEVAIREGRITSVAEPSADCEEGSCLACVSIPDGPIELDA